MWMLLFHPETIPSQSTGAKLDCLDFPLRRHPLLGENLSERI
jgi:hypothetical protein